MLIWQGLRWAEDFLRPSGASNPRLDAEVLLAEILKCNRLFLYSHPESPISLEAQEVLRMWVGRRSRGLPVAYILGKKEFWSLEFLVTPAVLIPRPETERLVEISLERARAGKARAIAEVGCGSGAVIVSLARALGEARFYAIDASREALGVARQNARRHEVADRILFLRGDLLRPLRGKRLGGALDQVVSNPPYIPRGEIPNLARDIRLYEPHRALNGGRDGLFFYRRLIPQALDFLRPGGWLILEMGGDQGSAILKLLAQTGGFEEPLIARDDQGAERVISAQRREG